MYADDLVIMSPSVAGLYKLIHICESFGLSHDVLFNNKKSTIMSFRAGNLKDAHLPLYTLNGEVLCDSACVKYLGHFICSDLSDDTDILRQRRCLTIQGNILLRKFHMCSIGVRLALFRSFCSPMYTSQLWWNYKKCTMKRLLITYHNVFKMLISMSKYESTSVLCTVYNVLCCQAVIRNIVYRFLCRLLGAVAGVRRRIRRDEDPSSGLASLRTSELLLRIAGVRRNEAPRRNESPYSLRGHRRTAHA